MLLTLHKKYTTQVLREITNLNTNKGAEILKGSFVNDLCELTNEYTDINNMLDDYLEAKVQKRAFDGFAFYQSHWGKLSALHSMARDKDIEAIDTQIDVLNWLNFLEFIVFDADEYILNSRISEFENILGSTVSGLRFKISSLLDTIDVAEAKYRAMGMILHIIEDSYTISHCKRDSSGIVAFYTYSEQSAKVHKKFDYAYVELEENLINDIRRTLFALLNYETAIYIFQDIFKLSNNTELSSSGGFVEDI